MGKRGNLAGKREASELPPIAGTDQTRPILRIEFDGMESLRTFCLRAAYGGGEYPMWCPGDYKGLENNTEYCERLDGSLDADCSKCWERALIRNAVENAPRREAGSNGMG